MNRFAHLRPAAAAALSLAALSASAGDVSPEVRRALARGETSVPVLVTRLTGAAGRSRPLPAEPALSAPGFVALRRFTNAPVVSGVATPASLASLAALPGVHVGFDRVVRPAGQVGTAQIGADRLLGLGVTGLGRSIAIVDSGIDLRHPGLKPAGGGAWPGVNLVDGGDLADCSGHGTEVAGVLAGPQGIAPEAGLVILKVFSERDGCKTARASDVLAAVDWAVSNAPGSDLEALNLSLADDTPRAGFCDGEDPAGAAVFEAARASGLTVAAAAGNDGRTSGLPWPACLSSVASVGMVYSLASGPVQWGGAAACTDFSTGPDVVPCASNTGSALSMLAPGVGWTTTASGGGQTSGFSGTSAAAPAASGALVLLRQARPLGEPALATDLLRGTGAPVRDVRTGHTAPRVDLGAALDAANPVAGGCAGVAIPDAPADGLACDVVVSSLVGTVSTVSLALAIDHPDPSQLVVTLTGPDGTRVTVRNRSGRAGDAVREVFGLTAPSEEPLSAFSGRPVDGTWRLTVRDAVPGDAGRLVSWALLAEPTPPTPEPVFASPTSFVATTVHHAGKLGSFFTTDLRLFNADDASPHDVLLRFVPAGDGIPRTLSVTLPPRGTRILDDVLHDAFRTEGYGPIFLNAVPAVVAATRTATTAPRGGAFGLAIPADTISHAASAGATIVLVPAFRPTGFRLNVGVTEVSGKAASVDVILRDASGAIRAVVPRAVPAGGLDQINDLYAVTGLTPGVADRVEVRVAGGDGRVAAWATAVDASSNDGSYVAARAAASTLLIPAVAHASGAYGSRFVTDLKLSNAGTTPVSMSIAFSPSSGASYPPAIVRLAGFETRELDDVLGSLFAPRSDLSGALRISVLDAGALYASTRTSTEWKGRSFGLAIDPAGPAALAGPGRRLALTFLSASSARRTNVGFVENAGLATHLRAALYTPDGTRVATRDFSLSALQAVQWNDVFAAMETTPLPDASLVVDVLDGGSVAAYAIVLDNRTNDASYFDAALVP